MKKVKAILAISLCLFSIIYFDSCKKDDENKSSNNPITTGLKIGDIYEGGIIFYLDATGQHGMVCATSDQATCINFDTSSTGVVYYIPNADGELIGQVKAIPRQ